MAPTFPSLAGQTLVAMPSIGDSRFERTVIYLCLHDANGAMGVIINKPHSKRTVGAVLRELDLLPKGAPAHENPVLEQSVLNGGPVEKSRGFLLHDPNALEREGTVSVTDEVRLSTTMDILKDIAEGNGPNRFLFALGFASWSAGQLDQEMLQNAWLNAPISAQQLFSTPASLLYAVSLSSLGVDLHHLSPTAGRG
ncbi:MAG: YqgE/AlgH family protein [Pseudomonadota bacterium]